MFWNNEHKIEVCEVFNDQIVSGPGVLDYPRAGYFLPVEYRYDDIDPLTQGHAPATPEILPDKVLFHFKAMALPAEEQLTNLVQDSKAKISTQRKASVVSEISVQGVPAAIPGDFDTQYEIVQIYDGSLSTDEGYFVIPTVSGNAVVSKEILNSVAEAITTRLQEAFSRQRALEDRLGGLTTLNKVKKFREKEL